MKQPDSSCMTCPRTHVDCYWSPLPLLRRCAECFRVGMGYDHPQAP